MQLPSHTALWVIAFAFLSLRRMAVQWLQYQAPCCASACDRPVVLGLLLPSAFVLLLLCSDCICSVGERHIQL